MSSRQDGFRDQACRWGKQQTTVSQMSSRQDGFIDQACHWGKQQTTVSKMSSRQDGFTDQAGFGGKQRTTGSHMALSPELSQNWLQCKASCNRHQRRQRHLYGPSAVLTLQNEVVTRSFFDYLPSRSDSWTANATIVSDSVSLLHEFKNETESPDRYVTMLDIHLQRFLWIYCPGRARVKGNDTADIFARKVTTDYKCLVSKISNIEDLETLPAGTKPRTTRHSIGSLDERDVNKY